MKCKHCQHELDSGLTICPECGTDNSEALENALMDELVTEMHDSRQKKAMTAKIAAAFAVLVMLLALLVVTVIRSESGTSGEESSTPSDSSEATGDSDASAETTQATIPEDTGLNDVTCKGTYTVADDILLADLDTVVVTLGEEEMTVADLQVYYWTQVGGFISEYYYYILYGAISFDYTQPLDTQVCAFDENLTWQQYFLDSAISCWQSFTCMALEAEKNGVQMSDDLRAELDNLEESLLEEAQSNDYADIQELLEANLGAGATYEAYARYLETYYTGYTYYAQKYEAFQPTDDEVQAYYEENLDDYASQTGKVVDVRHILIMPQGGTYDEESATTTYSDEEWDACYTRAEEILNEWLAGEKTEESFGELANTHSEDTGSNTAGGLYTGVTEGYMVEAFNDWCFDESRMPGDYGMVQTPYGWHVMYFVSSADAWFSYAQEDLQTERVLTWMDEIVAQYQMEADYSVMELGALNMGS